MRIEVTSRQRRKRSNETVKDLTGKLFGSLKVIAYAGTDRHRRARLADALDSKFRNHRFYLVTCR